MRLRLVLAGRQVVQQSTKPRPLSVRTPPLTESGNLGSSFNPATNPQHSCALYFSSFCQVATLFMLKSSHDLARSLRLRSHSNNVILRGIKTSHSICSTTSSTSIASTQPPLTKRATTRTSKSFSELPKTWTNADGTAAIPLSPWIGGLENSLEVSPKENVVSPTDDSANNIRTLIYVN